MVEVNGEWKIYKENKEVSALTLKEAVVLFLKDRAKSRKNTEDCFHRRRFSVTLFLLHLIWFKKFQKWL